MMNKKQNALLTILVLAIPCTIHSMQQLRPQKTAPHIPSLHAQQPTPAVITVTTNATQPSTGTCQNFGRQVGTTNTFENIDPTQTRPLQQVINCVSMAIEKGMLPTSPEEKIWIQNSLLTFPEAVSAITFMHQGSIETPDELVCFCPHRNILASAPKDNDLSDGIVKLWNLKTGERITIPPLNNRQYITGLAFSSDGSILSVLSKESLNDHILITSINLTNNSITNILIENSKILIYYPPIQTTKNSTISCNQEILYDNSDQILFAKLDHNATHFATIHSSGAVHIWDLQTRSLLSSCIGHSAKPQLVAFSRDGCVLAGYIFKCDHNYNCISQSIQLWDTFTGAPLTSFSIICDKRPLHLTLNHDGSVLAISYQGHYDVEIFHDGETTRNEIPGKDFYGHIELYDIKNGTNLGSISSFDSNAMHCSFSPDGSKLVTGNYKNRSFSDSGVSCWNVRPLRRIPTTTKNSLASNRTVNIQLSCDGNTVALVSKESFGLNNITIYAIESGNIHNSLGHISKTLIKPYYSTYIPDTHNQQQTSPDHDALTQEKTKEIASTHPPIVDEHCRCTIL
ncbi:MAG: hypothetical protein UU47_C0001G0040 [candidate division TM6 bacterium GW2011_GWE2_41_16]|nr:MAG: hypothetical protein UU47_C0001G0040 [candidate division TM6 bacterium GW2011_GWE2_41_16]